MAVTFLSGLLFIAIIAAGALWLRLSAGTLSLDSYLPEIEAALSERLPDASVSIGSAGIAFSDEGGAQLRVETVVFSDTEAGEFATIPEAAASFRLWDLIQGEIDPSNVILRGVSARLVRGPDGDFSFGLGGADDTGQSAGADAFARILTAATDGGSGGGGEALPDARGQILRLRDTKIVYVDRVSARQYRTEDADLSIWRSAAGVFADVDLSVIGGVFGAMPVRLSGSRSEDGAVAFRASFDNAAPRDIGDQIFALDWMRAFDAPVAGEIDLALDAEGVLARLSGAFEGGAGSLRLNEATVEPVRETRFRFDYDPANERFTVSEVAIRADRLSLDGAGFAEVNRDEDGAPVDVVAQLEFADITVAAPEALDMPLTYRDAQLTGRLTLDPLLIEIGEIRLARETMRISSAGRIWREDGGWRADMTARAEDFSLAEMLAHWPRQAAPGALLWMRENMEAAHIVETNAAIRLGGGADDVKIDFTFTDAVGHYLRPMPPIAEGVGSGQVDLKRFALSLDSGTVTVDGGEPLTLGGSTFVIEDLDHPDTPGTATILAKGRAMDALALVDAPPLSLISKLDAPLGEVEGIADIRAVTTIPLLKDLLLEDVTADAEAIFTDVALVAPGLGERVTAPELRLAANTAEFTLAGAMTIAGVPADVEWREVFSPADRRISVAARVTPERLAAFGVTAPGFNGGAASVKAVLSPGPGPFRFSGDANLTDAELAIDEIGWRKPAGEEARLVFSGSETETGAMMFSGLSLTSRDLMAEGDIRLTPKGALGLVDLNRVQYRGAVDVSVRAFPKDKRWNVRVGGRLIDFNGLEDITGRLSEGDDGPRRGRTPFALGVDVQTVRLNEEQFFQAVKGRIDRNSAGDVDLKLNGALRGGAPVTVTYKRAEAGGEVFLRARDAGRFLRDAQIFDDGAGGELRIRGEIAPGENLLLNGRAVIKDIVIHDDAKLEQMLSGAALDDLRAKMREDGMVFSLIRAPFVFSDGRVTLEDAVAKGPEIGVNVSGVYSLDDSELDFDGVFTPLYQINAALGKIPLLGDVITGGDGQGVFAFNFAVRGKAEDPKVSVNPLSVLTPGIFRNILGGGGGDADPEDEAEREARREQADK